MFVDSTKHMGMIFMVLRLAHTHTLNSHSCVNIIYGLSMRESPKYAVCQTIDMFMLMFMFHAHVHDMFIIDLKFKIRNFPFEIVFRKLSSATLFGHL